jgi:multidrug efflux pump subunit AcrA (membrane-fusion protein)
VLCSALLLGHIAGCTPDAYEPPTAGAATVTIGVASSGASTPAPLGASGPVSAAAARYPLEGICEVKPKTLVPIKSQANGEVTAVHVDVGDSVRKC